MAKKTVKEQIRDWQDTVMTTDTPDDYPTHMWECECGRACERWRGQGDVSCPCGRQYNAFGQLLAYNWAAMPENQSMTDSSIEFDDDAYDYGY